MKCPSIETAAKKYREIEYSRDLALEGSHNPGFEDDDGKVEAEPFANGSSSDEVRGHTKKHEEVLTPIDAYLMRISSGLDFLADRQVGKDDGEQTSREWMESASVIDRLMSIIFLLLGTFTTVLMICLAAY